MNVNNIPLSVSIVRPAIWAGVYTYAAGADGSWSWYKDKKRDSQCKYAIPPDPAEMNYAPHVTVSTMGHETGPNNSWLGFHVSIPLPEAGANARFNYSVQTGTAKFSNTTRKGYSGTNLTMIDRIAKLADEIDTFAQSFVTAAWR